jgi:HAD superfamily hydrolase (TIGR01549 family)
MKSYTVYIFDLDGTITNTVSVWLEIFRDCLRQFDINPPDDKTLAQHTHDWKQLLQLGVSEEKLPELISLAHKLANERLPKVPLHNGAYETLQALKEHGKKVAIFSTMDRPMFEPAMKGRNLYSVVEVAVAGTDVPHRKPHPAGIHKVFQDLNIPESEYKNAVYMGDKDTDIQAAHNAGIAAILYYPTAHELLYPLNELKKHNPEFIIKDWKELLI